MAEDIEFECQSCGQVLEAPEDYAGMEIPCPSCDTVVIVPGEPPDEAVSSCQGCGAELAPGTVVCMQCGMNQTTGKRITHASKKSSKSGPSSDHLSQRSKEDFEARVAAREEEIKKEKILKIVKTTLSFGGFGLLVLAFWYGYKFMDARQSEPAPQEVEAGQPSR